MVNQHLQQRLDTAFPASADEQVIRGVGEGLLLADQIMESEPILKTAVGRDLRGHIRRAGILFRIHDLCINGDLPFEAKMVRMPRGSWHWVDIKSDSFTAQICRTDGPGAFPEDTLTRQDSRMVNQLDMFDTNIVPFPALESEIKVKCAWLTYGASPKGKLNHLCWAMPSADSGDWLAHTDIMKRAAITEIQSARVESTKKSNLRFREHIEDALNKDQEESESDD